MLGHLNIRSVNKIKFGLKEDKDMVNINEISKAVGHDKKTVEAKLSESLLSRINRDFEAAGWRNYQLYPGYDECMIPEKNEVGRWIWDWMEAKFIYVLDDVIYADEYDEHSPECGGYTDPYYEYVYMKNMKNTVRDYRRVNIAANYFDDAYYDDGTDDNYFEIILADV